MTRLVAYDFPGNVRELENEIERAIVMTPDGEMITSAVLSHRILGTRPHMAIRFPSEDLALGEAVEFVEKEWIMRTMRKHGGNKSKAAKELGLSRTGLEKKISRLRLNV